MKFSFPFFSKKKKSKSLRGLNIHRLCLWTGMGVALLIGILAFTGLFYGLEARTFDLWMRLRGPEKIHPAIKIIGVDDVSLSAFGRWPWPRSYHANLLEALLDSKPKAIVYDMIFSEPTEDNRAEDQSFKNAIKAQGNVTLGSFYNPVEKGEEIKVFEAGSIGSAAIRRDALGSVGKASRGWLKGTEPTFSIPILDEVSHGMGFVNASPDQDGKIRRIPLVLNFENALYPSLALKGVIDYWNLEKSDISWAPGKELRLKRPDGKEIHIPVDREGRTLINYPGSFENFSIYSFAQLMVAYYDENPKAKEIFKDFKDSIVLMAITATASTDLISTPFKPLEPGIVMHAAILNTILQNNFTYELPRFAVILLLLVLGCLLGWSLPRVSPAAATLIVVGGALFYCAASFLLWLGLGLWLPVISVLTVFILTYLIIMTLEVVGERLQKQILQQELSIAQKIQRSFLPKRLPQSEDAHYGADCQMAKMVGGDLYDFIPFPEGEMGVAIGDVSGKGVPASLYMAKTISDFRTYARSLKEPAAVITKLNETLIQEGAMGMFVTFFYLVFDPKKKSIIYSSAGHHPLLKWEKATGKITEHNTTKGKPLGILSFKDLDQGEVSVAKGDLLVLYTDGIDEAMNLMRQGFGKERLIKVIHERASETPDEFIKHCNEAIHEFVGKAPQHDDMTLVVFRIN